MKLVASLTSPFARKVRILMLEKHLPFELVVDIPWNAGTQVPLLNPLGKVPVLLTGDNQVFYDSRVIVQYLETLPGAAFMPSDPQARLDVLRIEALADGIADAAAAVFIENRRPPEQISRDWIERQMQKVRRGLAAMDGFLGEGSYFVGGRFTVADMAAISTMGYLDFRFPELNWRAEWPRLTTYHARLDERESVRQTRPVG